MFVFGPQLRTFSVPLPAWVMEQVEESMVLCTVDTIRGTPASSQGLEGKSMDVCEAAAALIM